MGAWRGGKTRTGEREQIGVLVGGRGNEKNGEYKEGGSRRNRGGGERIKNEENVQ